MKTGDGSSLYLELLGFHSSLFCSPLPPPLRVVCVFPGQVVLGSWHLHLINQLSCWSLKPSLLAGSFCSNGQEREPNMHTHTTAGSIVFVFLMEGASRAARLWMLSEKADRLSTRRSYLSMTGNNLDGESKDS